MKSMKILLAALAFVGFAACSTSDTMNEIPMPKEQLTLYASQIVGDESRVTITDDDNDGKPTYVTWEANDQIRLTSDGGVNTVVATLQGGRENVSFIGEGEAVLTTDTYYALYPALSADQMSGSTFTVDYTTQAGGKDSEAALLVGKTSDGVTKEQIRMNFKPVNALLYVSLTNAPELSKVELTDFNGDTFRTGFTYDIAQDTETAYTTGLSITVTNPDRNGFFIAMPANQFTNGYVLKFTAVDGSVMAKGYVATEFVAGNTYAAKADWVAPSIEVGAKTSYSYYLDGKSTEANGCTNNVIYLSKPSYVKGVQKAMITRAYFKIDGGAEIPATIGEKSDAGIAITAADQTVSAWKSYSVVLYVETKHNGTIASNSTSLHITGLPYALNPSSNDNWAESNNVAWDTDGSVRLGYYQWGDAANITKSDFYLPDNVNVVVNCAGEANGTGSWLKVNTTFSIAISGNEVYSYTTTNGNSSQSFNCSNKTATMLASNPSIKCNNSYNLEQACAKVKSLSVTYGKK